MAVNAKAYIFLVYALFFPKMDWEAGKLVIEIISTGRILLEEVTPPHIIIIIVHHRQGQMLITMLHRYVYFLYYRPSENSEKMAVPQQICEHPMMKPCPQARECESQLVTYITYKYDVCMDNNNIPAN